MSDSNTQSIKPTRETYDPLQQAYENLNRSLFEGELPNCLITLQRSKKSYGYFCGDRFGRADGTLTDEIALNPTHFRDRPQEEVLATLAHEMVHLWQHHFGKPGRGRYHNKEWAEKMKSIGLQPTSTGKDDGAETGDVMGHIIVPDGPFDRAVRKLLAKRLGRLMDRAARKASPTLATMRTVKNKRRARAASASAMSARTAT